MDSIEYAVEILENVEATGESSNQDRAQAILEIKDAIKCLGEAVKELCQSDDKSDYFGAYLQAEFEGKEYGWLGEFLVDQLETLATQVRGDE